MKVELEHLVKRFGGENVIDDVSFSVETSALALIGSSGGGKSTLLRMLGGLLPATSGSIRMDGRLVPKTERECIAFRRTLGYVFQQGNLFQHLSAQENIALVLREVHGWTKEAADARAFELLAHFGLAEHADKHPSELSGGQQQRAAIARAVAPRPKLLLLDEPTSALDLRHQLIVMQAARSYAKTTGAAVLAIVHDLMLAARFSDKLLMLGDGTIRRFAAPAEVLTPEELAVVYRVEAAVERSQEGLLTVIPMTPLDVDDGTHGHGSHPHAHDPACTHSSSSD